MAGILDYLLGSNSGGGLYGNLLDEQQRSALSGRGLLAMAGAFADAGMPSRLPVPLGAAIGKAAAAMGAGQDEAANTALRALLYGEQAKDIRSKLAIRDQLTPFYARLLAGMGGGGGTGAAGAPGAMPAAPLAPVLPPAAPAAPRRPAGLLPPPDADLGGGTAGPGILGGGDFPGATLPQADTVLTPPAGDTPPLAPTAMGFGGGLPLAPWARGNAAIGGPSSVEGLRGEFTGRLKSMIEAMPPEVRDRFTIQSGFRDAARQAIVNPGVTNSRHTHGIAIDTTNDPLVLRWITENGPQFGVGYTLASMPNEQNHLEMLGPGGGRAPIGLPGEDTVIRSADAPGLPGLMRAQFAGQGPSNLPGVNPGNLPPVRPSVPQMIPGTNITPRELAAADALSELGGLGNPFKSLLDTYYKSPEYLGSKSAAEAEGARSVNEPSQMRLEQFKALQQRLTDMAKDGFMLDAGGNVVRIPGLAPLKEEDLNRSEAIKRQHQEALAKLQATFQFGDVVVMGPDGKPVTQQMSAAERARREREQSMRPGEVRPGDIVGSPANIGAIPQGYQYTQQPGGGIAASAIPETPEDRALKLKAASARSNAAVVTDDIKRATDLVNGGYVTGVYGQGAQYIVGTDRTRFDALVSGIGANLSIDRLQQMREQSATGGAVGNVTEGEHKLLRDSYGSLDPRQGEQQLTENMRRLYTRYKDAVNGSPEQLAGALNAGKITRQQYDAAIAEREMPKAADANAPIDKATFDRLPSGSVFTAPDGSRRIKP